MLNDEQTKKRKRSSEYFTLIYVFSKKLSSSVCNFLDHSLQFPEII